MIDTDKYERTTPELEEFEGETLGDTLTNLLAEVKRLQGILTNTVAGKGSALTGKGNIVDIIQIRGGSENHGENVHFTVMYEGGQVLSGWLENKESGWRYDGGESDE
tara:strand:- start:124 stop:444 length:321 start_codon:yes stop_codon:yes gene_type:complete